MKICCSCKKEKEEKEFSFKNKSKNTFSTKCKECTREYGKNHYANNKKEYINRSKVSTPKYQKRNQKKLIDYLKKTNCKDCGEADIIVLQFHHVDPKTKKTEVVRMVNSAYSWNSILEEIEKCEVLCANCHLRRHAKELGWFRSLN